MPSVFIDNDCIEDFQQPVRRKTVTGLRNSQFIFTPTNGIFNIHSNLRTSLIILQLVYYNYKAKFAHISNNLHSNR